jgi:hypothetical protein
MKRTHITLTSYRFDQDGKPWLIQVSQIQQVTTVPAAWIGDLPPEVKSVVWVRGEESGHHVGETVQEIQALIDDNA